MRALHQRREGERVERLARRLARIHDVAAVELRDARDTRFHSTRAPHIAARKYGARSASA